MSEQLSDLELTRAWAEAMGYGDFAWQTGGLVTGSDLPISLPNGRISYDPLHDDAQNSALEWHLIQNGYLTYEDGGHMFYTWPLATGASKFSADFASREEHRHAICLCAAKMHRGEA